VQFINPATGQAIVEGIGQSVAPRVVAIQSPNPEDIKHQPPEDLPT
jgi:hypothetical protein